MLIRLKINEKENKKSFRQLKCPTKNFCKANGKRYLLIGCGFDIETTRIEDNSYMYHWQFSFGDDVILGRTWQSFINLLKYIKNMLQLEQNERLLIYIANMGFEWQFMRKRIRVTDCMFKDSRHPLKIEVDEWIEFRDALAISGGSLASLAKDYTKTQKMIGDLDYNIKRNYRSLLTEKEELYCINDVVILKEFSEYIFTVYGQNGFLPLTKTSILRYLVKEKCKELYDYKKITYYIRSLFPETKDEYEFIMRYLFVGGVTHGMALYCGETIVDIDSYDIKSSYPAVELAEYYPVSPFKEFDIDLFENYINKYHVIFIAEFIEFKATTQHSIVSQHKCISLDSKSLIDNGRIRYSKKVKLFLTEIDYKYLQKFYKFKNMIIEYCAYAKSGKLPDYLIHPQMEAYIKKEELSSKGLKDTPEYANQKSYVNSGFGMCVTRIKFKDFLVDENGDVKEKDGQTYAKQCLNQILSPFWGIYITAYARYNLLDIVYKLKNDSFYQDTDSNKIKSGFDEKIINDYNIKMRKKIKKGCEYYNLDFNLIKGLGEYQKEFHLKRLKYLGAKRYIIEKENGEIESTISGLSKTALLEYAKSVNKDVFELFNEDLIIPKEFKPKKVALYNDEECSDYIDGVLMTEKSCVTITESDFNASMKDDYLDLIERIKQKNERGVVI